ncbi:MAG: hypothetical protein ABJF10_00055 [Chthoniobacter sp.]|uniref:hypothetical protein n=1 Tax=Chthoniobacter sp. TaxID=2510640 RepID=UPI0032AA4FB7
MTKHSIAAFCALTLAAFGFAPTSFAGDDGKDVKETKDIKEQVKESCITGDIGVTLVSAYISRGLVLENQGVIAQPYLDLYFKLYEGTGFINKVTLNLGLWSSIHSHPQPDGSTSTTRNWYEFDYTPGIAITFAKNFTFTASYFEFDSPADSFDTARSLNFNLAYDDTDLLGKFALHPHVTYLREITAPGVAGLGPNGNYYEAGIAPGFAAGPVAITFPITVGLGSEGFYASDTFGYVAGGCQLSIPLSFIPECYGKWTFSGGYTYYHLGVEVADATNTGHRSQHVFQGAVGLTF